MNYAEKPTVALSGDPRWVDGWLSSAHRIVSPNYDQRPDAMPVDLVVIHAISLPPGQFGGDNIVVSAGNSRILCMESVHDGQGRGSSRHLGRWLQL